MSTILMAWEMGGGLGHLMQLLPLAQRLAQRGHRLVGVFKDLSRVQGLFPPELIRLFQAPVKTRQEEHPFQVPRHFGHIIHNMGFSTVPELWAITEAWRGEYAAAGFLLRCAREQVESGSG